jgi:hypothetical protein
MAVAIDESRQNGLAGDVDGFAARRNFELAVFSECFESVALNHDHRIF